MAAANSKANSLGEREGNKSMESVEQSREKKPSRLVSIPHPSVWLRALQCAKCQYLVSDDYLMCLGEGHLTCRQCWALKQDESRCEFLSEDVDEDEAGKQQKNEQSRECQRDNSNDSEGEKQKIDKTECKLNEYWKLAAPERDEDDFQDDAQTESHNEGKEEQHDAQAEAHCKSPVPQLRCGEKLIRQPHCIVDRLLDKLEVTCRNLRSGCDVKLNMIAMGDHMRKCPYKPQTRKPSGRSYQRR